MLEIRNFSARANNKKILKNINLKVNTNEIVTIFGPNGSGKTALLKTIMGVGNYQTNGEILFQKKELTKLSIDQRAKSGICLMFQKPPKIAGVKLKELAEFLEKNPRKTSRAITKFKMKKLLTRDVNNNFSGGETKRSELLQLSLQNGKLFLLDEPDSGVDLENIKLIAHQIDHLLTKGKSALLITHTGEILKHLNSQRAYVLVNGTIQCEGNTRQIFKIIKKHGYSKCLQCKKNLLPIG